MDWETTCLSRTLMVRHGWPRRTLHREFIFPLQFDLYPFSTDQGESPRPHTFSSNRYLVTIQTLLLVFQLVSCSTLFHFFLSPQVLRTLYVPIFEWFVYIGSSEVHHPRTVCSSLNRKERGSTFILKGNVNYKSIRRRKEERNPLVLKEKTIMRILKIRS